MTPIDRFERRLPDELQELAAERFPDYTDDLLARTARTRQRPAWSLPMRWLPMTIALRRPLLAPPTRLLAVGLALLLALLAALAVAPILSGPRLPAVATLPGNGPIAYAAVGDIFVVDTPAGEPRLMIGGASQDSSPDWSPDGTRIAFWRADPAGGGDLMVAGADGSEPVSVYHGDPGMVRWSPDGTRFVWADGSGMRLIAADGSGTQQLDLGVSADMPGWRPDGQGLVFAGVDDAGVPGLYTVDLADGAEPRRLLERDPSSALAQQWGPWQFFWMPEYAPDGARILYSTVVDLLPGQGPGTQNARARMVDADGGDDHELEFAQDSGYETAIGWAPDGDRYALRVESQTGQVSVVVRAADDTMGGLQSASAPSWASSSIWSPDGTTLLSYGTGHARTVDATTGATTELPWGTTEAVDWQPMRP